MAGRGEVMMDSEKVGINAVRQKLHKSTKIIFQKHVSPKSSEYLPCSESNILA